MAVIVPEHPWHQSKIEQRQINLPMNYCLVRVAMDSIASLYKWIDELDGCQRSFMMRQVLELIQSCSLNLKNPESCNSSQLSFSYSILYVGRDSTDINLAPARISGALGVSVRYLRKMMRDSGKTLCRYILQKWLKNSHRKLSNCSSVDHCCNSSCFKLWLQQPKAF